MKDEVERKRVVVVWAALTSVVVKAAASRDAHLLIFFRVLRACTAC